MSVTNVSLDIFAKIAGPIPFRITRWQNHGIVVMMLVIACLLV